MRYKNTKTKISILCVLLLVIIFSAMGIYYVAMNKELSSNADSSETTSQNREDVQNAQKNDEQNKELDTETDESSEVSQTSSHTDEQIEILVSGMTLEEKIYQMMFVTPEAITGAEHVTAAGNQTKSALEKYPVGGIIYFAENIKSIEQVVQMISNTQSYSKIPLFIGVDEEGGRVSRLGNANIGVTKHPAMKEIGDSGDPSKAYTVGTTLGSELNALGFNVDFAPVADVIVNSGNQEIGNRSFGSEPKNVASMVSALVEGLESKNVSSVLKHFPGHGSTGVNSHYGYSESTRSMEELRNNEFVPFKAGIDAGADFVMISHMSLVNAIEEKVPASLSEEVITGMLKYELGFKGIVITDSLSMGAITNNYTAENAAVKAIEAGADMILMPQSIRKAYSGIEKAVADGRISEERIDESVRKILMLKFKK